ncbi:YbjN domain-containing protein [Micromonospora carbonacea]|uniref:YbjN domain-containing protein n=1 Tax=Micromonospora carbonacea TaxID=47853 RepID=UPI00371B6FA9
MTGQPRPWADRLAAAGDLPDGEERAAELDRIASAADAAGDLATGVDARFALMDLHLRRGERWRLFEPVRRCRELLDAASPDATAERAAELRRYQRFAVEAAFGTPRVGLGQTRAALDDLARHTPEPTDLAGFAPGPTDVAGFAPGPTDLARQTPGPTDVTGPAPGGAGDAAVTDLVAELRCRLADHLGDEPEARRWYDRWRTAPADPAAGCPGCAPSRRADLLAGWGDWAAALAELRPVVDGPTAATPAGADRAAGAGTAGDGTAGPGGAYCTDQPERALAGALLPLLRAGEPERAGRAHVTAYRRHRRERTAFGQLAAHLRFCALGGHLDRGLDILAEQLPRLDRPSDDLAAMEFAAAGALLCALAAEAGRGDRRMPGPAAPAGRAGRAGRAADDIDVARLGGLLAELATGLAGSFDARNGTGHQSGRIAALLAERPVAGPVTPLPTDDAPDDGDPGREGDDGDPDGGTDDATGGDPDGEGGGGPAGREAGRRLAGDEVGALTVALVTEALDRRGDAWTMRGPAVVGRWGPAVIEFRQAGERGDILHARVLAVRRLPATRRAEAYAFCNVWNHDRLLPKAYAHDDGSGELVLAGDVSTDLAHGVAPTQLDVLVTAAVATGVAYAEAVAALP